MMEQSNQEYLTKQASQGRTLRITVTILKVHTLLCLRSTARWTQSTLKRTTSIRKAQNCPYQQRPPSIYSNLLVSYPKFKKWNQITKTNKLTSKFFSSSISRIRYLTLAWEYKRGTVYHQWRRRTQGQIRNNPCSQKAARFTKMTWMWQFLKLSMNYRISI